MTTRHITITPMAETPVGRHIAETHANHCRVIEFLLLAILAFWLGYQTAALL